MNAEQDCKRPITSPRRLLAELYCLTIVFIPHKNNDNTRKYVTIIVVLTWAVLEVANATQGILPGGITLPSEFHLLRLFVGILIGRMWGIQFNSIAGVTYSDEANNQDNGGDNE